MSAPSPVIQLQKVVKTFGSIRALQEFDLEVQEGQVHGLLGPNGAGKSTAIRLLLGILKKDSGEAVLLGKDPWHDAVALHHDIAYVPGDVLLWENLTGGEIIDVLTKLRGRYDEQRRQKLIERFQLDPRKKFRTYSKGNRQKVALVAALASDVPVYIFDEPTAGLDPLLELVFQDEVKKLKDQGKTILLSSHILAEVEALCDAVTIIRDGVAVETGTLDELRHLSETTIKAVVGGNPEEVKQLSGIHDLVIDGQRVSFLVNPSELNTALARLSELDVQSITSHPPTLEELFISHYEDDKTSEAA